MLSTSAFTRSPLSSCCGSTRSRACRVLLSGFRMFRRGVVRFIAGTNAWSHMRRDIRWQVQVCRWTMHSEGLGNRCWSGLMSAGVADSRDLGRVRKACTARCPSRAVNQTTRTTSACWGREGAGGPSGMRGVGMSGWLGRSLPMSTSSRSCDMHSMSSTAATRYGHFPKPKQIAQPALTVYSFCCYRVFR